MKLLFVLNDSYAVAMHSEYTGCSKSVHRRSVMIELTPEQEEIINQQKIGISGGSDKYETIESISLTD